MILYNNKNISKIAISPIVHEEMNGIYEFTFSLLNEDFKKLDIDNSNISNSLFKVSTPQNDLQLFRLHSINYHISTVELKCYHIFYDLNFNLIEDIYIQGGNGAFALNKVLEGCKDRNSANRFTVWSDVETQNNCRIVRYNGVQAIIGNEDNTIINRWGGQLERDNFKIKLHKKMGINSKITIAYKLNMTGFECNLDSTSVVNKLYPRGGDNLEIDEKYLKLSNKQGDFERIKVIDFDVKVDEENGINENQAKQKLKEVAKDFYKKEKLSEPKITYRVSFIDLSKTKEYKNLKKLYKLKLGDTIKIYHEEHKINTNASIIEYSYNPISNQYEEITLGNYEPKFTNILTDVKQAQRELKEEVESNVKTALEEAKAKSQEIIDNGFGGFVKYKPNELLIMDTNNEKTKQNYWQWNQGGLAYFSRGKKLRVALTKDGDIVADSITTGTLNGALLKANSVTGTHIAANTITGNNIKANTITGNNIKASSITANELSVGSIKAKHISAESITSTKIQSNAIDKKHMSTDSVGSNEIIDDSISSRHIKELTVDLLRPGNSNRIIFEGENPGDNDALSIDCTGGQIRLKYDASNYVHVTGNSIQFVSGNATSTDGQYFYAIDFVQTSDVRLKENIKFLDKKNKIKPNEEVEIPDINSEEIYDFIKNINLATYNYKFSETPQVGLIAQNVEKFGNIKKYLITENGKWKCIQSTQLLHMTMAALKKEMNKNEELRKKVDELDERLKKLENQ